MPCCPVFVTLLYCYRFLNEINGDGDLSKPKPVPVSVSVKPPASKVKLKPDSRIW